MTHPLFIAFAVVAGLLVVVCLVGSYLGSYSPTEHAYRTDDGTWIFPEPWIIRLFTRRTTETKE